MSENDKYTREGDKRFTLRIEKELFKRIEDSARAHRRSIGREIEYLLELQLSAQSILENNADNNASQDSIQTINHLISAIKSRQEEIAFDESKISPKYREIIGMLTETLSEEKVDK